MKKSFKMKLLFIVISTFEQKPLVLHKFVNSTGCEQEGLPSYFLSLAAEFINKHEYDNIIFYLEVTLLIIDFFQSSYWTIV